MILLKNGVNAKNRKMPSLKRQIIRTTESFNQFRHTPRRHRDWERPMSVFGGDSWAREAQQRKRRVDDLALEQLNGSSYKKLSGGKYACLVCPHSPILDSPLMLSVSTPTLPSIPYLVSSILLLLLLGCFLSVGGCLCSSFWSAVLLSN